MRRDEQVDVVVGGVVVLSGEALAAVMGNPRPGRRRRRIGQAATVMSPRTPSSNCSGKALAAAALCRGGAKGNSAANGGGVVAAAHAVKEGVILLDKVEDVLGDVASKLVVVVVPLFHLLRLSFGLSLMFYGMAFRTFAFHVIVFRIAGLKQVRSSLGRIVSSYRGARKTIREAAIAAEKVGDRVVGGDDLKAAREAMVEEKKRLLSDGFLSAEETHYFMEKYNKELLRIKEEQDRFKSARSSIFSVRKSVDPKVARTSVGGLYSALVASFTASTIQTAGQITLGLHMGNLLKTHILDLFGPILDPIGYRLDLDTYYDKQEIPYMGKANAMDGPSNLFLNVLCYSTVYLIMRVHPSVALKCAMVYYGARVVTDYVIVATEPFRRKFGQMTIIHTPWSAVVHIGLTALGFYFHRNTVHTAGTVGFHPFLFGPGLVGLVEPLVRMVVKASDILHHIDFFKVQFVADPMEAVKSVAQRVA
eukprot:jgi/Undpi1/12512/HiC_scaffold_6.g02181.m1